MSVAAFESRPIGERGLALEPIALVLGAFSLYLGAMSSHQSLGRRPLLRLLPPLSDDPRLIKTRYNSNGEAVFEAPDPKSSKPTVESVRGRAPPSQDFDAGGAS